MNIINKYQNCSNITAIVEKDHGQVDASDWKFRDILSAFVKEKFLKLRKY